ncbi:substrate-binding domain-containing protein [Candidatus Saccharibacteria bacterium]|nr:substrate-binding domain-containing protein [Candidatus Saccharibacteria bacterium]
MESDQSKPEAPQGDPSSASLEQRNIQRSPNIVAAPTGPSPEELAERKAAEERAKLDELTPIVNQTLIDDGKSMEKKHRRPFIIALVIVLLLAAAMGAGLYFLEFYNKEGRQADIPLVQYKDEVKIAVDQILQTKYELITSQITNFEKLNSTEISDSVQALTELTSGRYDLLLAKQQDLSAEQATQISVTPFLNDAFVVIANQENSLDGLSLAQLKEIYSGALQNWPATEVASATAEQALTVYASTERQTNLDVFAALQLDGTELTATLSDDVIESVASDSSAIAVVAYSRLTADQMNTIKILALDDVMPSVDTIGDASYPLSQQYALYSRSNVQESAAAAFSEALISYRSYQGGYIEPIVATNSIDE